MDNPYEAAASKSVYYPDELAEPGTVELVSEAPVEADDVPHDDAKHGDFIKVETSAGEVWFAAPKDLIRALGDVQAEPGHIFQVRATSRGDAAHDPWEIEVAHDPEHH
jgi:hypothetical protein